MTWFPDTQGQLQLVGLLVLIGEASIAANTQYLTANWSCLLPRLIPAPQALLKASRPTRLPSLNASIIGVHSGTLISSLNYSPNLIHPITKLQPFEFCEVHVKYGRHHNGTRTGLPSVEEAPKPSIQRKKLDYWTVLDILSCLLAAGLLAWAIVLQDGPAVLTVSLLSVSSLVTGLGSLWTPQFVRRSSSATVPAGDLVIRTREGAFVVVKCTEEVARELYFGTEECLYAVKESQFKALVALGTVLLMVAIIILGSASFTMQLVFGIAYIILNLAYWLASMLQLPSQWDLSRFEWEYKSRDQGDSFTGALWRAIHSSGSTDWVSRSAAHPQTDEWKQWLKEAQKNLNNPEWDAVKAKDKLFFESLKQRLSQQRRRPDSQHEEIKDHNTLFSSSSILPTSLEVRRLETVLEAADTWNSLDDEDKKMMQPPEDEGLGMPPIPANKPPTSSKGVIHILLEKQTVTVTGSRNHKGKQAVFLSRVSSQVSVELETSAFNRDKTHHIGSVQTLQKLQSPPPVHPEVVRDTDTYGSRRSSKIGSSIGMSTGDDDDDLSIFARNYNSRIRSGATRGSGFIKDLEETPDTDLSRPLESSEALATIRERVLSASPLLTLSGSSFLSGSSYPRPLRQLFNYEPSPPRLFLSTSFEETTGLAPRTSVPGYFFQHDPEFPTNILSSEQAWKLCRKAAAESQHYQPILRLVYLRDALLAVCDNIQTLISYEFCDEIISVLVNDIRRRQVVHLVPIPVGDTVKLARQFCDVVSTLLSGEKQRTRDEVHALTEAFESSCRDFLKLLKSNDNDRHPIQDCALVVVQVLDLVVASYSGTHFEPLQYDTSGEPLSAFKYPNEMFGLPDFCLERKSLRCLGSLIHKQKVWVFRLAMDDIHYSHDKRVTDNEGLYVSTRISILGDIWGPLWGVTSTSGSFQRYDIGTGSIIPSVSDEAPSDPGERLCHYAVCSCGLSSAMEDHDALGSCEVHNETTRSLSPLDIDDLLLIGTSSPRLQMEKCHCSEDEIIQRLDDDDCYHTIETRPSFVFVDSTGISAQAGQYVMLSASQTWKTEKISTKKQSILSHWEKNPLSRSNWIAILEQYIGVVISICTFNASRVSFAELLATRTMRDLLQGFEWSDEDCKREYYEALEDPAYKALSNLWNNNPKWHSTPGTLGEALHYALKILSKTGLDYEVKHLNALYKPRSTDAPTEFKRVVLEASEHSWVRLLRDTDKICTMAVMIDYSLSNRAHNGRRCKLLKPHRPTVLETSLRINTRVKPYPSLSKVAVTPSDPWNQPGFPWEYAWDLQQVQRNATFYLGLQGTLRTQEIKGTGLSARHEEETRRQWWMWQKKGAGRLSHREWSGEVRGMDKTRPLPVHVLQKVRPVISE